ncbi:MAG: hypothetical protein VYD18_17100, partial [Candidatus Latescibacterota bacterium]|nr:hypothetical protein [Candidatus Latescibacterota bacterium]
MIRQQTPPRGILPIDVDEDQDLLEDLPASVQHRLQALLRTDESVELVVASDIRADGRFGPTWLVSTSLRILSIDADVADGDAAPAQLLLADVLAVELRDFHGSGALH